MDNSQTNGTMPMMPSMMRPPIPPDTLIWMQRNHLYPQQVWWILASFIGLVAIAQFLSWVGSKASSPCPARMADAEAPGGSVRQRKLQLSRLPLAIVNWWRVFAFRNTVEFGELLSITYAEAFITVGYIVALFTWEFINTTNLAGQPLDWRYYSSRAGALAVSQFPLVTVLGTKNNVLAYITGVSYDKLNYLHRMTARVNLILLWIHAGAKAIPISMFIRIGLTAIVAYTIVLLLAFRPIRARFYELFFFAHFSLILVMLIGAYYHANQAARLGVYIYPCFLIWGLDRFLRVLRLVYFNNHLFSMTRGTGPSGMDDGLSATAVLLSPQFVRLRVTRPSHLKWTPGQAAYLIMPGVSTIPIEAHPFTIASVDTRYRLLKSKSKARKMERMDLSEDDSTLNSGEEKEYNEDVLPYWEELDFLINVRDGVTKRLAERARKGGKVKVWVDGPYGFSPNLRNDDVVVLVAGGSGVSLAISMFLGVVSDVQNMKARTQKVVFIWSIRDSKQLEWITRSLLNALELAPSGLEIVVRIFITGHQKSDQMPLMMNRDDMPPMSTGDMQRADDGDSMYSPQDTPTAMNMPRELKDFSSVHLTPGRPELGSLLRHEVQNASGGRLSVTVCGGPAIAKTCREALKFPPSSVLYGGPSVVLHIEAFGYA
ncbi:hypothetical protein DICSQDRAFT_177735 [Dichomitus squalens LYAD-421 SS1]|uniref:uncharacterized protein n=1 Tax=Dichomitus squalens (strain LYAD-421) TaxID=732165 RepID=UPI0004414BB8|nr:uncharacterized protein DICSQDRAFT_177735 [Dichomitus squalens LYAD-421 SS1]EJF65061.1 hypothetical protein DICSQDRAFT_177735 [Dichomitus squalens LYAD-421 SS1]